MSNGARRVLIVDDDDTYRTALARAFERRGFAVAAASSVSEALALIERGAPDYASIDLRMPGGSGLALVRQLKERHPCAVIVVLTGYGSIATAVNPAHRPSTTQRPIAAGAPPGAPATVANHTDGPLPSTFRATSLTPLR